MDEGYIKYKIEWNRSAPVLQPGSQGLIRFRNELKNLKLIGVYPNGVGYGNISERLKGNEFLISGTQTGHIEIAGPDQFSRVVDFDIGNNFLACTGPVKASSEALTHAAFYLADKNIMAVIHIHHAALWKKLMFVENTTAENISFGTPQMANAIIGIVKTKQAGSTKMIVAAGHEDGIFVYGNSLQEAFDTLMQFGPF